MFSLQSITRIICAVGYQAPEYVRTGRLSEKSDVFSFGVVLFQVLFGREVGDLELMEWNVSTLAPRLVASGRGDEIIDPALIGQISDDCLNIFVETASKCLLSNGSERPLMLHVMRSLEIALELQESADAPAEESGGVFDDSSECSLPH